MKKSQSFVEKIFDNTVELYQSNKVPFLATLLTGILAYGFVFANKLPNGDDLYSLFGKGATATSGRWGLDILTWVIPNFSAPWIQGMLTLILLGVSICIIVRLFSIENNLTKILLAGSIVVFPGQMHVFGYMFTSAAYGVGILMAVLSTWLIVKSWETRRPLPAIWALACMVFSIGIYQAYIILSASLMVVLLIRNLALDGEDILKVILKGIVLVVFLGLCLVVYYLVMEYTLIGTELNSYAASAKNFQIYQMEERILLAYESFIRFFTECYRGLMPTPTSVVLHLLMMAGTLILVVISVLRQECSKGKKVLILAGAAVLTAVLPLAITSIYLFVSWWTVYAMVLYSFVALYVYAAVFVDHFLGTEENQKLLLHLRNIILDIIVVSLAVIVYMNIWLSNQTYLSLHMRYENMYAFSSTLVSELKTMPEFVEGRKIAIVGEYENPEYYERFNPKMQEIYSVHLVPDMDNKELFIEYYLGLDLEIATAEEIERICQTGEYEKMPCYPYHGSTQLIQDILVVKLS